MNFANKEPSEYGKIVLVSLKEAVTKALERKRRLGQYAVFWENGEIIYKGDDAPHIGQKQNR
ncbi:MAG: hypothetical protein ACU841_12220 [Gammaproteobacteria bacterium]